MVRFCENATNAEEQEAEVKGDALKICDGWGGAKISSGLIICLVYFIV